MLVGGSFLKLIYNENVFFQVLWFLETGTRFFKNDNFHFVLDEVSNM